MKLASLAGITVLGMAAFAAAESLPGGNNRMSIHEWGTFTVLQDEKGNAVGGVNTDDEPVPDFVHSLDGTLIQNFKHAPNPFSKGVPRCDPSITVRLETPVLYFHPPVGFGSHIDVDVQFRGGWLTQYYPDAAFSAPGLDKGQFKYNVLTDRTLGSLSWHNLTLSNSARGPETADPVWLAPRHVEGADITAKSGESERFIFYRGVGHVQTPVRVTRIDEGRRLRIQSEPGISAASVPATSQAWLVDVRRDGTIAFRATGGDARGEAIVDASFAESEYATDPADLRKALRAALTAEGLFGDEAEALLNTWDASYFRRAGLRLFYMVPRDWTDSVLPLKVISNGKPLDADIKRVMVGRIELVTPGQRKSLAEIARGPASNMGWLTEELNRPHPRNDAPNDNWYTRMNSGHIPRDIEAKVPADYRAYIALGRFRNALVLDELTRHPTPALKSFVTAYSVAPSTEK
jgi:hypothetical protein